MRKIKIDIRAAFSLMEMMIVLLIISIIAAASAPMVSKKLSRDAGTGENPWTFTDLNGSMVYNMNGNNDQIARIGRGTNASWGNSVHPRLYIDGGDGIAFGNNGTYTGSISIGEHDAITLGRGVSVEDVSAAAAGGIAIGSSDGTTNTTAKGSGIAIGRGAIAEDGCIVIGGGAKAEQSGSIAIGSGAEATSKNTARIGNDKTTVEVQRLRVMDDIIVPDSGLKFSITDDDTAILQIEKSGEFIFGTEGDESLTIKNNVISGLDMSTSRTSEGTTLEVYIQDLARSALSAYNGSQSGVLLAYSDRRLKNIGDKFTDGLDALKKLDFFHYTFKEDKDKIPHVGVMAQDLQKVFPNAVITGEDGYLRIRLEDMFYAVINAVKELDTRISEVINQVKANVDEITKLKLTVENQQKTIDELKAQNAEFEKRLAKLEKGAGVKSDKPAKVEKSEKTVKVEKPAKEDKSEKPAKEKKDNK